MKIYSNIALNILKKHYSQYVQFAIQIDLMPTIVKQTLVENFLKAKKWKQKDDIIDPNHSNTLNKTDIDWNEIFHFGKINKKAKMEKQFFLDQKENQIKKNDMNTKIKSKQQQYDDKMSKIHGLHTVDEL